MRPGEIFPFLQNNATPPPHKPLAGRADFNCDSIRHIPNASLDLDDNWVPPRHVDIVGWPEHEDAQKSIAQALSEIGIVYLP